MDLQASVIPEWTVQEAASVLGVSRRTVLRLLERGLLRFRSTASPFSKRPRYRIPKIDVLDLRNDYAVRATTPARQSSRAEAATRDDLQLLGFE